MVRRPHSPSEVRILSNVSEFAIALHIEPLEEGGYVATSADVPGLVAEGRTIVECVEIAQQVARKIAESCIAHGDPLPPVFLDKSEVAYDYTVPVQVA